MDVANCTSMKKCRSEKLRHFQSTDKLLQTQKFPEQLLEKLKFLLTSSTQAAKSVTYLQKYAPSFAARVSLSCRLFQRLAGC